MGGTAHNRSGYADSLSFYKLTDKNRLVNTFLQKK